MRRNSMHMALGAIGFGLALAVVVANPARAATMLDFQINPGATSVTIANQSGGGLVCAFSNCGVNVDIASGLPTSFSLGAGDTYSFDFITWTSDGSTGFSARQFSVNATVAFNLPLGAIASSSGNGAAFFISGVFTGGVLNWNNVPTSIALTDGSVISIDFEDGLKILPLIGSITTHASVTVESVGSGPAEAPIPTPLPLAAPLFGAGLGVLGLLSWRRKHHLPRRA